jgi:Protein of unknown function (DUF1064)
MRLRLTPDELAQLPQPMRVQIDGRAVQTPAQKASKYGNTVIEADGIRFDSKLEARRYQELLQMQAAELITALQVHVPFALHARGRAGEPVRIGAYEADFAYRREGVLVVEDCKSAPTRRTAIYRWKAHHFAIEYGLTIIEIERNHRPRRSSRET